MADYSRDFQVSYDPERASCTIRFRCFDTPNSVTLYDVGDGGGIADCSGTIGGPAIGGNAEAGRAVGTGGAAGYEAEDVLLAVRRTCLEFHNLWSFTLEGSDVSRLNQPCERVRVDRRTVELIQAMKAFHDVEPAFDFTIGPVSFLWKHAERVPSDEELARSLEHVGAGKVAVEGDTVVKADPLVQIDVGGAAKGFVADAIVSDLRAAGVKRADIDLGGNLFMMGDHPQGRPWRVAVRIPEGYEIDRPVVKVVDKSVVTSGSYERFAEIDGKRYQHIIDARTGWPCESDIVSATVVSASSLEADLLATTACLIGSKGLIELAIRHPECRFVAITAAGEVLQSL